MRHMPAASVGLETETFLAEIRENMSLRNLGLLVLETGTVKRDTWTSSFSDVIAALNSPDSNVVTPVIPQTERIPGASVHIPDPNLRAAIEEALGKKPQCLNNSRGNGNGDESWSNPQADSKFRRDSVRNRVGVSAVIERGKLCWLN